MTDLKPFFEAHSKHHFNVYEKALYITLIEASQVAKVKPHFTFGDLELRSILGISQPTLRDARTRLQTAGLICFTIGNGKGNVTQYYLKQKNKEVDNQDVKTLKGETPFHLSKKTAPLYIYNNNILVSNINNNSYLKKEKINKKEKKQEIKIESEPTPLIPEIIQINNPQPIEIEKLISNTTERHATQPKRTKTIKQPFTPPTREDIKIIAKKHWEGVFNKERRLEWANITGTPSTQSQIDYFYEYWTAANWRNNKNQLQTNPARNWATWINLSIKNPHNINNGNSKHNGGNTAGTNSKTSDILSNRYAEICEYLSRGDRQTAVAIWGESDVRAVEERATVHA
jgi:hypothetical protein